MTLPSLHDTKDFVELVCAIAGTGVSLGVWGFLRKLGKAPKMIHEHREAGGPLHAENIRRLFEEKAG
jgi:hypothetical protein